MTVTVAQLIQRARSRADMVGSSFVDDEDELIPWVNASYKSLYDLLVSKFQDYYVNDPTEFTLSESDEGVWDLPATFYKLLGIDRSLGGDEWEEVRPFNFNERNARTVGYRSRLGPYAALRRRIIGDKVHFKPTSLAPGTYRAWIIPRATDLTATTDEIDGVNGWEEMIVLEVARKCLLKEESDTSGLDAEIAAMRQRIEILGAQRDAGSSDRIQDVRGGSSVYGWEGEEW